MPGRRRPLSRGDVNKTLTLGTAELCADAVQHGRVPGRDFHVRPTAGTDGGRLRVEVSGTRAERLPTTAARTVPGAGSESGRGLLLVAALADDRGVTDRRGGPGKTVWARWTCPDTSGTRRSHPAATGSPGEDDRPTRGGRRARLDTEPAGPLRSSAC
ncbi:ATP-binding protein [Streptomyces prasinus]